MSFVPVELNHLCTSERVYTHCQYNTGMGVAAVLLFQYEHIYIVYMYL